MEYGATYDRLDPWIFKAAQIDHKTYLPLLGDDAVEHGISRIDRCLSVMFGRHREFWFLVGDMLDILWLSWLVVAQYEWEASVMELKQQRRAIVLVWLSSLVDAQYDWEASARERR